MLYFNQHRGLRKLSHSLLKNKPFISFTISKENIQVDLTSFLWIVNRFCKSMKK